ncbi:MAG: hypothetical protein JWM22_2492, partial [Frankiales bacterium]|nr:hypothetical protein [Frankiales bacterium]
MTPPHLHVSTPRHRNRARRSITVATAVVGALATGGTAALAVGLAPAQGAQVKAVANTSASDAAAKAAAAKVAAARAAAARDAAAKQ